MDISAEVKRLMAEYEEEFIETFHHAHQYPEMSFKEFETTAYIKEKLTSWGIEFQDIGLETGCVGILKGAQDGPVIALRADIDALPVLEESTHATPSKNTGVMHACGHDTHYSSLLGAAHILSTLRDQIKGTVKFFFQPAEEINLGAKKMLELGALENPKVDAVFGLHNSPEIPLGTISLKDGPLMAGVNRIEWTIKGHGGHGGIPQRNIDPVVCAAAIIQAAQTVVARNISPLDSAVVSICNVRAGEGTTNNVCPETVRMLGTVRHYRKEDQDLIIKRLNEITDGICAAYGCTGEFTFLKELPVTDNKPEFGLYDVAKSAIEGCGATPIDPIPSCGGEDFSIFTDPEWGDTPGFFYWLGTRNEANDCVYSWHSPHFKFDDTGIKYGAGVYAMSVFKAIEKLTK